MTQKTLIIAEAGVNHNGSIDLARQLIDVAVEAGADAVKFQSFKADSLVTRIAAKAEYQKKTDLVAESQYEMLKRLELGESEHLELMQYCKNRCIQFLSTPFDESSISLLQRLGMDTFKVPSGEITNLPYLRRVAEAANTVILSTGMSNLGEIESALNILMLGGVPRNKITVLHATTEYPCPMDEVNLSAMQTIRQAFGVNVGYSDHTEGIEISLAAVAMGARIIEKHFTLDRNMEGPDHRASLEPAQLRLLVRSIRNIERAMGDGIKCATQSERLNMKVARKSIVAARSIPIGEVFDETNLTVKRPAEGLSPMRWDDLIGTCAGRDYQPDEMIKLFSKKTI
jgi:N,N'-diacetyllegionaminate synthase